VQAATPEQLLARLLEHFPQALERSAAPAAIWQELARRGYSFAEPPESHAGDNDAMRLETNDWFDAERFQAQRRSALGENIETWAVTTSTNDLAFAAAAGEAIAGSVWIAEEQTAGRGRQGRSWLAPPFAALLFSVLLPVRLPESPAPQLLPLALALGMCDALVSCTDLPIRVRWPNDLMLHDRKLGGMLVEVRGAESAKAVLGAGINVGMTPLQLTQLGLPEAGTLAPHLELRREALLAELLWGMETRLVQWRQNRFDELLDDWVGRDGLQGRQVMVQTANSQLQGQVIGIDQQGLLELRDAQGTVHRVSSAEVHIL
jgi:BirA family biotin operon repressor/biotin-[acetyl-CoA-carboxylase] ligase